MSQTSLGVTRAFDSHSVARVRDFPSACHACQTDWHMARRPSHMLRVVQHECTVHLQAVVHSMNFTAGLPRCPQAAPCATRSTACSLPAEQNLQIYILRLCRLIAFCTQRENHRRILEMLLYWRWRHRKHHRRCPRPHHCSSVPGARSVSRRYRLWSFTRGESSPVYPRAFPGIIARLATSVLMWRPICSSTNAARNT